tara:strand:- start:1444 stop:2007 length:564 start_codon:yes stop_codon:yes gene_type:complete
MKINESKKRLVLESCSEDFVFHYKNQIPISENIFRPGSKKFFSLFNEARFYYEQGLIDLNEQDYSFVVKHDLGKFGYYEGQLVPLDFPILLEAKYKGREVTLGAKGAQRAGGGKAKVYVRDPKTGKVKPVTFGSDMSTAMGDSDEAKKRRKNFGDRHNCSDKTDKTAPGYWSCRLTKMFGKNIPGWW